MGGILNLFTSLVSSFITYPILFVAVYGTLSGMAYGTIYMLPICIKLLLTEACGWKYFPFERRRISSLILAGYSLGSAFFTLWSFWLSHDFAYYMRMQAAYFKDIYLDAISSLL